MSDEYAEWDAAYVLGALSSAERREYEEHVDGCVRCAAAVAELGMMPGLLRLVPVEDAPAYLEPEPPHVRVPAARRSGRRWPPAKALAAAAVVVLLAAVGTGVVVSRADRRPSGETVALGRVTASPLRATVLLTPRTWGTEIAMTCTYTGEYGASRSYALYVVDRAGHRQVVSRWSAAPGETARTTGSTDLARGDIARIELRSGGGTLLLARAL